MKKSLGTFAALCGMCVLPAFAGGEVGVLADQLYGQSQTLAGTPIKMDAVRPTGWGVRGAWEVLDLKFASLGVAATYHAKASEDVKASGVKLTTYGAEYFAVGAQLDWKFLVNLHAGVDLRRERYTTTEAILAGGSTNTTRAWVKAGVGYSIPTPVVSPFVRLEVAVPVSSEDKTGNIDEVRRALAPRFQLALYGGIRF